MTKKQVYLIERVFVVYFLTSHGTVTALTWLDLYSTGRVLDIFCGFVTSKHSSNLNNAGNVFEVGSFYWSPVSLVNEYLPSDCRVALW